MRPASIVIACIFLALAAALTLGIVLLGSEMHPEYRAQLPGNFVLFLAAVFGVVCCFGFWQMKRWAVIAYSAAAVVQIVIIGMSFVTQLPLVIATLGLLNWSDLS